MKHKSWFWYALIVTLFWGVWGALSETSVKAGIPPTIGYVIWAITLLVPAIIALKIINWKPEKDKRSILYGFIIGLSGSAGQLVLFQALKHGPAYLIFPFVSLSPLVTVFLSFFLLKEKIKPKALVGIIIALFAIPLLSYQQPENAEKYGSLWILLALAVFLAWGVQAYYIKVANNHMKAESIFFYMTLVSVSLIPVAIFLTDFSAPINWGTKGLFMAAGIQLLNSIGALLIVYAFRYGKAIIVSPLINTGAPVITIAISLIVYGIVPHLLVFIGMLLALLAIFLLTQ
ncbi:MAG: DMT family transporter [Chitinophagaceae bacterium]|nr:DMT family transporter [Chitinophagaceae bacterium]